MYKSMFRSLWWVIKGLAVAPPGITFIMGVSIYKQTIKALFSEIITNYTAVNTRPATRWERSWSIWLHAFSVANRHFWEHWLVHMLCANQMTTMCMGNVKYFCRALNAVRMMKYEIIKSKLLPGLLTNAYAGCSRPTVDFVLCFCDQQLRPALTGHLRIASCYSSSFSLNWSFSYC